MEFGSHENTQDTRSSSSKHGVSEEVRPDIGMTKNPKEQPDPSVSIQNSEVRRNEAPATRDAFAEINMEVSTTADDVLQAGGFGATDNISAILPVASDFTDFEDHLCKVRGYEDSEDSVAGGQSNSPKDIHEVEEVDIEGTDNVKEHVAPTSNDAFEAVSMGASVTSDEMIRAGGFGAMDDISSFLPVASDFTDFEANLRDARGYEDLNEEIKRPGLGWTNERK